MQNMSGFPAKTRKVDNNSKDTKSNEYVLSQPSHLLKMYVSCFSPIATIAPLYQMPYDPDQLASKQRHAIDCLKKIQAAVKRVCDSKRCGACHDDGYVMNLDFLNFL